MKRLLLSLAFLLVLPGVVTSAYGQGNGQISSGDGPIAIDGPLICGNVPSHNAGLCVTHENAAGIGGYRKVATIAERNAIPVRFRDENMIVDVDDDGSGVARRYTFPAGADTDAELENADWIESPVDAGIRAAIGGGGGGATSYDGLSGTIPDADVPQSAVTQHQGALILGSNQITSGVFNVARIPTLPASVIGSGTFPSARIAEASVTQHQAAIAVGAAQVTSGTLDVARIPSLDAAQIASGSFPVARIPSLPASQITSGTLDVNRLPDFSAAKITSGTLSIEYIDDRMATDTELDGATFWEPQAANSASFTLGGAGTSTGDPGQYPITGSATITLPTPLSLGASVERADTYEFFADGGNYTIQVQDDGTSSLSQTCVGVDEVGEGIIIWPRSDTAWRVFCRVNEAEGQAGAVAAVDLTDIEGDGGGAVDYTLGHYLIGNGTDKFVEGAIQIDHLPAANATQAELEASHRYAFCEETAATLVPDASNIGCTIDLSTEGAQSIEMPSDATVDLEDGQDFVFQRTSTAGDKTFTFGSGAALDGSCVLDAPLEVAVIRRYDTNAWRVMACGESQTRTDEEVEDIVGGTVSGNTETLITVTYQAADNTLDFEVDDDLANYDNTTSNFATKASLDAKADLAVASAVETGSFTVSAGQVGEVIRVTGTGPYTATIPAGLADGGSLLFWNETSNDLTISGASAAYDLPAGETAAFIESADAVDEWNRLPGGGSAAGVTFEALNGNGDVGTGAAQLAAGDHGHTESDISDLSHTVDTSAATECSGDTTYLDGEGNCDDISSVYEAADANIAKADQNASWDGAQVGAAQESISQVGGTLSWDLDTDQSAVVTLTAGATLANPTNQVAGHTYLLLVKQDATGSRTLAFGTAYLFPGGTAPTLSTAANAVDMISCLSDGTDMFCTSALDFQ